MPFIAKNPINSVALNSVPATPIPGTRSIFPMNDGWYEMDSDGNVRRLGADNIETIELTTTNIGSLTVSSELNNLRDNKIYKIKCGYKYGWLFVTQRELETKNTIQTIIDFDGSIYHRYRYIADITSEDRWSDWILIPDDEYLRELLVASFDERGIRQPYPIPSYDELTEHGVYSLRDSMDINEYVFSVHSPYSSAEITQYRLNSKEGLLKRTYSQNMETGEKSWSDWIKYISTEDIDTALSETSTNPVQNKVIKQAIDLKAEQLELERLKYYGDKDILPSDESYFTVNSTGETITGLTDAGKTQTELVIPYKINGKEITTLGDFGSILEGNSVITKVVIPNSVTTIGNNAFNSCSALTSINIPNSVTSIEDYAFADCTSLTSISIPDSVTSIGDSVFSRCSSLISINIPDSVTSIKDHAFSYCTSLTSINIPNSVTSIGWFTFRGCTSLTSISIPNSVTSIDDAAFYECTNLTIYCEQGSYADTYAKEHSIPVKYTDIDASKYITKDIADSTYATKTELLNNIETVSIASITNHSFTNSTELDSLNSSKIYKLEHGSYVGWLFVSRSDTNPPVTQILIDTDGAIFHREYRETTGFAWSEWRQDYKDYTDSLERVLETGLITVGKAKADINGNPIDTTYATKTELRPTPITSTTTAITANNSYNYGEQTELSIAFPTTANDGDVVYITFTSGATATVLTIDTTNTSDIELIPEANTGYEVYAKYNGTIWIVNYSDYTVTAEAGA